MNNKELLAAETAGKVGGKYLETIGIFDLSKLSKEQWLKFLEIVCSEYAVVLIESLLQPHEIPY
jgi:hypothetical protein